MSKGFNFDDFLDTIPDLADVAFPQRKPPPPKQPAAPNAPRIDNRTLPQILQDQYEFNLKLEGLINALMAKIRIQDQVIAKLRKDLDEKRYGLFDDE